MPELPEVETVRLGLSPHVIGKKVSSIQVQRRDLRYPIPSLLEACFENKVIQNIRRRSKYLLFDFEVVPQVMIVHLGMSGRLVIKAPQDTFEKHTHVTWNLGSHLILSYNDPRRFGCVTFCKVEEENNHPFFRHLGPDPLTEKFSASFLKERLSKKKAPIKTALLDQQVIAGLGNIYVCEALFRSKISPFMPSCQVSFEQVALLIDSIRSVLKEAIDAGGSSLKDHRQANGELGYFQHAFKVYARKGEVCKECRKETIILKRVSGRSTYFCNFCQRLE